MSKVETHTTLPNQNSFLFPLPPSFAYFLLLLRRPPKHTHSLFAKMKARNNAVGEEKEKEKVKKEDGKKRCSFHDPPQFFLLLFTTCVLRGRRKKISDIGDLWGKKLSCFRFFFPFSFFGSSLPCPKGKGKEKSPREQKSGNHLTGKGKDKKGGES